MSADFNSTTKSSINYPTSGYFIGVIIVSCLCLLFGTLGNLVVIIYNICMNHTKTPATYFVLNLAISDIIVCCTFFPTWIVKSLRFIGGQEVGSANMICKISVATSGTSVTLSVANLLAITIDRFIFISRPLKYLVIITWEKTYFMLTVVWITGFMDAGVRYFYTKDATEILFCRSSSQMTIITDVLFFYIPVVTLIYLNYKVFKVAQRQGRTVTNHSATFRATYLNSFSGLNLSRAGMRQLKLVKTFLVLLGISLFCFIPYAVVKTMDRFETNEENFVPTSVYVCAVLLVGINSVSNPFIYGIHLKEYRNALRNAISKMLAACT